MAYKTILMHCNDVHRFPALLAPTLQIASAFQSHIVGLAVVPPVSVVSTGALEAPPIIVDAQRELYRKDVPAMRKKFEEAMTGRPVTSEWRDMDAGPFGVVEVALEEGRTADLIVALQEDADWPLTEWLDVTDHLALEGGRPVLIIPNGRAPAEVGRRVLIAWNGRREAARAVFDALPLLKKATAVRVVRVGESDASDAEPVADICQSLVRHGVKVGRTATVDGAGTSVGAVLLAEADTFDADLVVMGCYGHSRLREFVFGGATRHFLHKMHTPVLMSH